jgi:hypothetical protein
MMEAPMVLVKLLIVYRSKTHQYWYFTAIGKEASEALILQDLLAPSPRDTNTWLKLTQMGHMSLQNSSQCYASSNREMTLSSVPGGFAVVLSWTGPDIDKQFHAPEIGMHGGHSALTSLISQPV